ncbi:MAG: hypothetical protein EOL91_10535 [Actinobacteria bacterium]|nr:hypothetical protein [Actinomycetota bacterium]
MGRAAHACRRPPPRPRRPRQPALALRHRTAAEVRRHAADTLSHLGSPDADDAAPALAAAVADPDEAVRLAALNALGQLLLPSAWAVIDEAAGSAEHLLRVLAERLGERRPTEREMRLAELRRRRAGERGEPGDHGGRPPDRAGRPRHLVRGQSLSQVRCSSCAPASSAPPRLMACRPRSAASWRIRRASSPLSTVGGVKSSMAPSLRPANPSCESRTPPGTRPGRAVSTYASMGRVNQSSVTALHITGVRPVLVTAAQVAASCAP